MQQRRESRSTQQEQGQQVVSGNNANSSAQRRRPEPIRGTRTHGALKSGPPVLDLFVFRVNKDNTKEELAQFLTDEGATVKSIERVSRPEMFTKSFHVILTTSDTSKMLEPNFWPEGICCRKYFTKRFNKIANNGDTNSNK